ncbi:hypothetical protein PANO111632_08295 [Paracoccus nototheniae]
MGKGAREAPFYLTELFQIKRLRDLHHILLQHR